MRHLIFFCLILLLFGSCTIEKRLYRKGFHMERRSAHRTGIPTSFKFSPETVAEKRDVAVIRSVAAPDSISETPVCLFSDQPIPDTEVQQERLTAVLHAAVPPNDDSTVASVEQSPEQEQKMDDAMKNYHFINGIIGLIFFIAILVVLILLVANILVGEFAAIPFLLLSLLLLLLLVLIVAIVRDQNRPDRKQKRAREKAENKSAEKKKSA